MKNTLKTISVFLFVLAYTLAACSPQATAQPTNTAAPTATEAPQLADPTPTTAVSTGSEGPLTYRIVADQSRVSYEVGETFINQNNKFATAIGVTQVINGEIQIDPANPQDSRLGTFTVDISQFKSDSSRRDNAIRERFIQTAQYPIVTFVPTQLEGLPDSYTEGEQISFKVTGDVTIRETTRPLTFEVTARLEGDTLTGTATTTFLMSEFAFGPISIAGILNTEDQVKITLEFVARPG